MNDNRTGGMMLVAGSVAGVITMAFHPVAARGGALAPHLATLDRAVHGLALASVTMVLLGALALTRRLAAGNRLSLAALTVYGLSASAILVAGVLDGFVAADLLEKIAAGDPKLESWWTLLQFNGQIVRAFAAVYTVGASVAIFLWSLAIWQTRRLSAGLAWCGLGLAPALVLTLFSGHLAMSAHGFGLVALAQGAWFVAAGVLLARSDENGAPSLQSKQSSHHPATGAGSPR